MLNNSNLIPIGETAEIFGVSVDTLRMWEKEGILNSTRPNGKIRYFSLEQTPTRKPKIHWRKYIKEKKDRANH